MKQDFQVAMKKAETQIQEIIDLDTTLLTLHQQFPRMSNDEKELALERYKELLDEREELLEPIVSIQEYLNNVISDLDNLKFSSVDKISHWFKIRRMNKAVGNLIDFIEDETSVKDEVKQKGK